MDLAAYEAVTPEELWHSDPEALIHGVNGGIVIPGEPVFGGERLDGQAHHLRVTSAKAGLFPNYA